MGSRINFRWGSFDLKLEVIKPHAHSPTTFNQNSEIAILFIAVEGSVHYVLEEDTPARTALRARVVSYA